MKKFLPIVIFILLISIFFRQFLFHGMLPIPSDTIVGLYYPFRDLYAKTNPNGIAYKNFLITDPVRQQYPWKQLAISIEKKLQLPLWNPYSFSGTPLLANFQSGVFYPLNIFFFFLPFSTAWSLLILSQPILAGLFFYFYVKNLKLHSFAALLGATVFAFCGFSIAWLEWNTIVATVLWLPLILLAKDKLLQKWTIKWTGIFLFAEIAAFFAGHLQVLFYALCISNTYLFVRILQKSQERVSGIHIISHMIKRYIPYLLVGMILFSITLVQWIPTLQFISLSARSIDQNNWHSAEWFVPWQHLIQFVAPDFFGNPATLNYWGVWNYGEFIGYIGIFPLVLAFLALFFRHDKKTLFYGILFFLSLIFSLPTFFAKIPFLLSVPFLSSAQPTRLLFVTDFSLAILSALGFDYFLKRREKIMYPLISLGLILALLWFTVLSHIFSPQARLTAQHNLILPSSIFLIVLLLILPFILLRKRFSGKAVVIVYGLLFLITFLDLFRFGQKFTPFTQQRYLFPKTSLISFLQQKSGNYRLMTTDDRILPPNFSLMYKLQSVDGYDPLYLQDYAQLIAASQRNEPNIDPPFGFNRIITPHNFESKIIDLLGVKYVISLTDIKNQKLKKVFQEGQTQIYENKNVLPRAFFVRHIDVVKNKQDAIDKMFESKFNFLQNAVVIDSNLQMPSELLNGTATITNYSENTITIATNTPYDKIKESLLVLTDSNYPTWQVTIDGVIARILPTDYAFRGVFVASGKHTVVFSDKLFFKNP